MHSSQTHIVAAAMAAMIASGRVAVPAQTTSEPPATRSSVLDAARDALASQSTPPTRSKMEQDWNLGTHNQYVLAKIFGGWKGIRIGGGDFPAGAGMKFGVGFDKGLTTADPDLAVPNRVDLALRGAYSTRGYARVSGAVNARSLGGAPIDVNVFGQFYEFPQEDYFGPGMDSLEDNRTHLDAVESGGAVHRKLGQAGFRRWRFVSQSTCRTRNGQSVCVRRGGLQPGNNAGARHEY